MELALLPVAAKSQIAKFVVAAAVVFLRDALPSTRRPLAASLSLPLPDFVSSAVLRL